MKETLIREFCQSECLWNPKDKNYRCHRWKKVIMSQIARKMSIIYAVRVTENELLRQWNMLRDQFRRAKRTGKDQWRFYDHLLFLDSVDFNKDSTYWTDNNTTTVTATISTLPLASALESLQSSSSVPIENMSESIEHQSTPEMDSQRESDDKNTVASVSSSGENSTTSNSNCYSIDRKRHLNSSSIVRPSSATNLDLIDIDLIPSSSKRVINYDHINSCNVNNTNNTSNNSNNSSNGCTGNHLIPQQFILPKVQSDDQFTHFARTIESKLRLVYQMSPADGIRLQKKISDLIFEKEMEFIEKSTAITGVVHNLFS
ncbi:unnamed protein product [Anisakis simplex]|uniref:MADF domain-containing protein n=1 Tax=Anisakis simplex TaxID=6269 RepID=A0A0M3KF36_ANISI|nr:unnamed protein product [Anisakis simplex]